MKKLTWERNFVKNPVEYYDQEQLVEQCHAFTEGRTFSKSLNGYDTEKVEDFYQPITEISQKFIKEAKASHWKDWGPNTWRIMPAEVGSTLRIIEKYDLTPENTEILLMVSDTGESYVSSQVMKNIFTELGFETTSHIIHGFQMEDMSWFSDEGLPNFIEKTSTLLDKENFQAFNITGGYKNFIPLVTHIASFHGKDMFYVFEEAVNQKNSLVKIPKIPTLNRILKTNSEAAETLLYILSEVNETEYNSYIEIEKRINDLLSILGTEYNFTEEVVDEYSSFIIDFFEQVNGKVRLSFVGQIYLRLIYLEGNTLV